ncbi:acyltransferase family protein [Flavobacterium koreense]
MLFFLPLMHLNSFLIGNLGGMYFVKYGAGLVKNYDVPLVLMVLILITILSFPIAGLNYFNGFLSFIMIPIILLMSLNNGKITSLLNRKPFVFLGEISFSMYLLQFPLFVYSRDIVIVNTSISFFIKFIILIIVSSLAYLYVEKPLRVHIKNFSFSKLTSRL